MALKPQTKRTVQKELVILGLVILIVVGAFFYLKNNKTKEDDILSEFTKANSQDEIDINSDSFQAVFLTNGQVYFGKLKRTDSQFYRLEDVYYINQSLQTTPDLQNSEANISLTKLGAELHGPQDFLEINLEHILIIEDMRSDSQVVKAIIKYKQSR